MNNQQYQQATGRTWKPGHDKLFDMLYLAAGIGAESGEVLNMIKKHAKHNKVLDVSKIEEELGDLLWYATRLADILGLDLSSIMAKNIAKLEDRHKDGDPSKFYTITDDSYRG